MTAEEIFQVLERDAGDHQGLFVFRRVLPETRFNVQLEVAGESRHRRLSAQGRMPSGCCSAIQTRGVKATYAEDSNTLRIELLDPRLAPLFSTLVESFLSALRLAGSGEDAVTILLDRFALWQRLLDEVSTDGLSGDEQRGLFAELEILRLLMIPALGGPDAVSAWVAPTGSAKDFVSGRTALEVKSRFRKGNTRVRISSEDQLACVSEALFLAVVSLDENAATGVSLPELVTAVRCSLQEASAARFAFDDLLMMRKYLDSQSDLYARSRYAGTVSYFQVTEGFPRIIPSDLPTGVIHISYDLELAHCASFAVGATDVAKALTQSNG